MNSGFSIDRDTKMAVSLSSTEQLDNGSSITNAHKEEEDGGQEIEYKKETEHGLEIAGLCWLLSG